MKELFELFRLKKIASALAMLLITSFPVACSAFYEVHDSSNIAQAVQQVAYQYQQVQMQLQNLAQLDPATAAANAGVISDNLAQLQVLNQQMNSLVMDYNNFQKKWDQLYQTGIGGNYAAQANQLLQATDRATYDAMRMQGFAVSNMPGTAANLNGLIAASQSAQGALAAAQAGNQIAAMQAQQMLMLQQMVAANNQAQLAYQKQREQQNADAEAVAAQAASEKVTPRSGQGPGFGWQQ